MTEVAKGTRKGIFFFFIYDMINTKLNLHCESNQLKTTGSIIEDVV